MPTPRVLDRAIDERADSGEGFYLEYSGDNGVSWTGFAGFEGAGGGCTGEDTGRWEPKSVTLDVAGDTVLLRMAARSSWHGEVIQVDNVKVSGLAFSASGSPAITAPADATIEAIYAYTGLTDALIGTATATDDSGVSPTIMDDRLASYQLGTHTITHAAIDGGLKRQLCDARGDHRGYDAARLCWQALEHYRKLA